jgi:hypothetical protein
MMSCRCGNANGLKDNRSGTVSVAADTLAMMM